MGFQTPSQIAFNLNYGCKLQLCSNKNDEHGSILPGCKCNSVVLSSSWRVISNDSLSRNLPWPTPFGNLEMSSRCGLQCHVIQKESWSVIYHQLQRFPSLGMRYSNTHSDIEKISSSFSIRTRQIYPKTLNLHLLECVDGSSVNWQLQSRSPVLLTVSLKLSKKTQTKPTEKGKK